MITKLMRMKCLLNKYSPDEILNFSITHDALSLAQMEILSAATVPAYIGYPDYFPLIVFELMNISLTKGNCYMSPYGYMVYGLILCNIGEAKKGYKYGKMALKLMEKLEAKQLYTKLPYLFSTYINHWNAPLEEGLIYYKTAMDNGLETGDYEFASYAADTIMLHSFYVGENIKSMLARFPKQHRILENFGKAHAICGGKNCNQMLLTLKDPDGDGVTISGDIIKEQSMVPFLKERKNLTILGIFFIDKMQLAYLAGDYKLANEIRPQAINLLKALKADMFNVVCHYFSALTCIGYYRQYNKDRSLLRKTKWSLKKLKKWAENAPHNYLHKAQLVEAEFLAVKGRKVQALYLYNKAIENAQKSRSSLGLGIACECMGRYLEKIGHIESSKMFIHRSISVFHEWGAHNKSYKLCKEYRVTVQEANHFTKQGNSVLNMKFNFDALANSIQTIINTSQFHSLLETIMEAVLQHSGATYAAYINTEQGKFKIQGEKKATGEIQISRGKALHSALLQLSIVNIEESYNTSEYILKNLKKEDNTQETQDKSLLIIPLKRHKKTTAILYLENELVKDAFREDHIQYLSIFGGLALISIENAFAFEKIDEEHHYYSNIIKKSPSLICGIRSNGITTFVNPVVKKITGYQPNEVIGKNWWELFYPGDEYKQVNKLFQDFEEQEVANYKMSLTCKNGEKRVIAWNSHIQRDNDNNIIEIIGIGNSISPCN